MSYSVRHWTETYFPNVGLSWKQDHILLHIYLNTWKSSGVSFSFSFLLQVYIGEIVGLSLTLDSNAVSVNVGMSPTDDLYEFSADKIIKCLLSVTRFYDLL